jgi:hypothetical protein
MICKAVQGLRCVTSTYVGSWQQSLNVFNVWTAVEIGMKVLKVIEQYTAHSKHFCRKLLQGGGFLESSGNDLAPQHMLDHTVFFVIEKHHKSNDVIYILPHWRCCLFMASQCGHCLWLCQAGTANAQLATTEHCRLLAGCQQARTPSRLHRLQQNYMRCHSSTDIGVLVCMQAKQAAHPGCQRCQAGTASWLCSS